MEVKMGFDLYGFNPDLTRAKPTIDWESKPTAKEKDDFFKDLTRFEDENVGYYFRNNVWWWRPLANYVLKLMGNEFTEEEQKSWHHNDGFEVSEEKATKIAERLEQELNTSRVKQVEEHYKKRMKEADETNKLLEEKKRELEKIVQDKTGEKLAPVKYPEPFKSQWEDIQKQYDWEASYPFSESNVIDFMKFCRASRGFSIC
jgi:protoheme ferro-lyase|tara:strand:+ start:574 stop:1179 length:606 start_codon:yes stop_codon:yes gene_type:complete